MSNYRRLISYIYAYEGGIKGKNIGFAKIETKGIQCKITVSVKRIYVGGNDIGVYLLSAEREIYLGSIFIRGGSGEFRAMVSSDDIENSGISMDQCFGLTVHDVQSTWRSYTTIWEDAVAHAAEVELEKAAKEGKEEEPPAISEEQIKKAVQEIEEEFPLETEETAKEEPETQELVPTEDLTEDNAITEDAPIEETKQEEDSRNQELAQAQVSETEAAEEIEEEQPKAGKSEIEGAAKESDEEPEAEIQDLQPENADETKANVQNSEVTVKESTDIEPTEAEPTEAELPEQEPEEKEAQEEPLAQEEPSAQEQPNMPVSAAQEYKNDGQEEKPVSAMNKMAESNFRNRGQGNRGNVVSGQREALIRSMRNNQQRPPVLGNHEELERLRQNEAQEEISHNQIWERLKKEHTRILAFDYEHGCEILTIKPQDIGLLPRETWVYGNNSFLLHGYYNYRYLILAKLLNPNAIPRYLLGVPGHYFSNERYMASMFGFPNFVLSKDQPKEDGRFGFWYTDVKLGG